MHVVTTDSSGFFQSKSQLISEVSSIQNWQPETCHLKIV